MSASITTAVLPVAGLGTRFLPVTKAVPKEILPLVDRPCIEYVVAEAVEAGLSEIVFVTSRGKSAIEDYFDRSPHLERVLEAGGKANLLKEVKRVAKLARCVTVRQPKPLGLGHAVACARPAVGNRPFCVLLGDDIIDGKDPAIGQLLAAQPSSDHAVVALMEVPEDQTNRYGICAGDWQDGLMQVTEMVEKPLPAVAPSRHAIVGRYVLPADTFGILDHIPRGAGGEFQLTDALAQLASEGRVVGTPFAGKRFDTGNVLGLIEASIHFTLARPELRDGMQSILRSFRE